MSCQLVSGTYESVVFLLSSFLSKKKSISQIEIATNKGNIWNVESQPRSQDVDFKYRKHFSPFGLHLLVASQGAARILATNWNGKGSSTLLTQLLHRSVFEIIGLWRGQKDQRVVESSVSFRLHKCVGPIPSEKQEESLFLHILNEILRNIMFAIFLASRHASPFSNTPRLPTFTNNPAMNSSVPSAEYILSQSWHRPWPFHWSPSW